MANRYHGSYRKLFGKTHIQNGKPYGPRGVARAVKAEKAEEAFFRNDATPHINTRQHRQYCQWNHTCYVEATLRSMNA